MSVETLHTLSGPYIGNGTVNQEFPVTFQTAEESGIEVYVDFELIDPAFYTFDREADGLGSVYGTFVGEVLISSNPYFGQETEFQAQGPIVPSDLNPPLDKGAIRDQYLKSLFGRTMLASVGKSGVVVDPDFTGYIGAVDGNLAMLEEAEFQGPQGEPGGNVMSIGLFTAMSTITVALGTALVHTSGYSVTGKGDAFYFVFDLGSGAANAAYVAANPRTASVTANGRYVRLSETQTITPYMFGCLGVADADTAVDYTDNGNNYSSSPDDTVPLQAFFDFLNTRNLRNDCTGMFAVSTINVGGTTMELPYDLDEATVYGGNITFCARGATTTLVTLNVMRQTTFLGVWRGIGIGGFLSSTRTVDNFIDIQGYSQLCNFVGGMFGLGFRYSGVLLNQRTAGENIFGNNLGSSFFIACGMGSPLDASRSTTTWNGNTQANGANNYLQRSEITPGAMPPAYLDVHHCSGVGGVNDIPMGVRVTSDAYSELHYVQKIDRAAGKIWVFPAIPSGLTSGNLLWYWGGGAVIFGGDAGLQNWTHLGTTLCGIGKIVSALYPPTCINHTSQNNGIVEWIGAPGTSIIGGGNISTYIESGHDYQFVWGGPFARNAAFYDLGMVQGYPRFADIVNMQPIETMTGTTRVVNANIAMIYGLKLNYNGRTIEQKHRYGDGTAAGVYFDKPMEPQALHTNTATILVNYDAEAIAAQELYVYDAQIVYVSGAGSNGAATSITISQGAETVPGTIRFNGGVLGASLTLTGMTGVVAVLIQKEKGNNDNFLVYVIGPQEGFFGSVVAPTNHANTTVALLQADLGAYRISKTGGSDGVMDASAKTAASFTGDFEIEMLIRAGSGEGAFGVRSAPGGVDYTLHNYGFYWGTSGVLYANVLGTITTSPGGPIGLIAVGDRLRIRRRSGRAELIQGTRVLHSLALTGTMGVEFIQSETSPAVDTWDVRVLKT